MEEWAKTPAAVCANLVKNCKQFLYQKISIILFSKIIYFILYQILISCNSMEINYLKIVQCDFLDFV